MKLFGVSMVVLLAAAAPLHAQEQRDPLSLIPGNAMFVTWSSGPKKLTEAFADARLGRLLGGPELDAVIRPILEAMREAWAEKGLDAEAAEVAAADYEGRVILAGGFDHEKIKGAVESWDLLQDEAEPWGVFLLSSDGHTDLAGWQEKLIDRLESEQSDQLRDLTVEGRTFRVAGDDNFQVTLPFMEGPHLMMVGGAPLESALSKCLLSTGQSLVDGQFTMPRGDLGAWVDLRPIWHLADEAIEEQGPWVSGILDTLGVSTLEKVVMTARAGGEHVIVDVDLRLGEGEKGLLGAMTEVKGGEPALLDIVPLQREVWSVSKLEIGVLYEAIMKVFESLADVTGQSREDLEGVFTETFRVRLKEDLIDHLGGELLSTGSNSPPADEAGEGAAFDGLCYGIALKNSKRFDASLETLLRSRGLHAARKTEDYRGYEIRKMTVMGMLPLRYVVSERILLVGLGERGGAEMRAVLDEEKARSEGKPRAPMPAEIGRRLDQAVPGWQSISVLTASSLVEPILAALRQDGVLPDDASEIESGISMAMGLLDRYRLQTMVTVTKARDGALQIQFIW